MALGPSGRVKTECPHTSMAQTACSAALLTAPSVSHTSSYSRSMVPASSTAAWSRRNNLVAASHGVAQRGANWDGQIKPKPGNACFVRVALSCAGLGWLLLEDPTKLLCCGGCASLPWLLLLGLLWYPAPPRPAAGMEANARTLRNQLLFLK